MRRETHRSLMKPNPFSFLSQSHSHSHSHSHNHIHSPLRSRYFCSQPYPLMALTPTCSDSKPPQQPGEHPARSLSMNGESRVERAWAHWAKLGRPKLIVAPMVDNSELPFRMLCRKYGAQAAYTPMLHSRIFTETEKYRKEEFTTCKVFATSFLYNYNCIVIVVIILF